MSFPFLPPEMQAEIQRQMELQHADITATRHDITRLLSEELDAKQLATVRLILHECEGAYAAGLAGYITAILEVKHKVCPGCGKDHEAEERALLNPDPQPQVEQPAEEEKPTPPTEAELSAVMAHYGLRYHDAMDIERGLQVGEGEKPVFCLGCGMLYQSLEDRMLRPPGIDGCTGCQHKSAHG